jgi:WD40 repeat protein
VLQDLTNAGDRSIPLQINGANPHGTDSVFNLVFSHDGSLLVTASRAGNIAIWERSASSVAQSTGSPGGDPLQWTLKQNVDLKQKRAADIWAVDIDRTKQTIAVGLGDGYVCLLWLDDLDRPVCPEERTRDKAVKSVKFLPDKPILVSAGNDAKVTIWDLDSSARTAKPSPFTLDHNNAIWDVDFNRDGTLLATASFDGSVRIYQTGSWRLLNTVAADRVILMRERSKAGGDTVDNAIALRTVRFDPSSSMLVTSSLDHTARVWTPLIDRASIQELSYRLPPVGNRPFPSIYSVAIQPTGDGIAFTDQAAVYVQSSGKPPKSLPLDIDDAPQKPGAGSDRVQQPFSQVLIRAPNEVIASASEPRLTVWTLSGGDRWVARKVTLPGDSIRPLPGHSKFPGRGAAIDAAGAMLAVEVRDGQQVSVVLCPLRGSEAWTCSASGNSAITTLSLNAKLPLHPAEKDCASSTSEVHIAVSRSGRLVAASAGSCPIQIFDAHNRNRSRFYSGHHGDINTLDFSPDETALVAASQAGDVRIWDLAGATSRNISNHTSPYVTAARYSPSGQWVISVSNDNSVIVSSAESGEILFVPSYRNSLFDLVIESTPRGVMMATGSEAGDVNVMHFFENGKDIASYAKSVLRDVSP